MVTHTPPARVIWNSMMQKTTRSHTQSSFEERRRSGHASSAKRTRRCGYTEYTRSPSWLRAKSMRGYWPELEPRERAEVRSVRRSETPSYISISYGPKGPPVSAIEPRAPRPNSSAATPRNVVASGHSCRRRHHAITSSAGTSATAVIFA